MLWPDEKKERREKIKEELLYFSELLILWAFLMFIIFVMMF